MASLKAKALIHAAHKKSSRLALYFLTLACSLALALALVLTRARGFQVGFGPKSLLLPPSPNFPSFLIHSEPGALCKMNLFEKADDDVSSSGLRRIKEARDKTGHAVLRSTSIPQKMRRRYGQADGRTDGWTDLLKEVLLST